MLRTVGDQPGLWEAILPPELLVLPEQLAGVDDPLGLLETARIPSPSSVGGHDHDGTKHRADDGASLGDVGPLPSVQHLVVSSDERAKGSSGVPSAQLGASTCHFLLENGPRSHPLFAVDLTCGPCCRELLHPRLVITGLLIKARNVGLLLVQAPGHRRGVKRGEDEVSDPIPRVVVRHGSWNGDRCPVDLG